MKFLLYLIMFCIILTIFGSWLSRSYAETCPTATIIYRPYVRTFVEEQQQPAYVFTMFNKMSDYTTHGYTITYKADIKFKDPTSGKTTELNGTAIRNIFTNTETDKNQKYQQFKAAYKVSDKKLFWYMYKILTKNMVEKTEES